MDINMEKLPDIIKKVSSEFSDKFKEVSEKEDLNELAKLVGHGKSLIQKIITSYKELENVVNNSASHLTEVVRQQEKQLQMLKESMSIDSKRSPNSYLQAVSKDIVQKPAPKLKPKENYVPKLQLIEIAPNTQIKAYRVKFPHEAHKFKGDWCFCHGVFYISISGYLLSGQALSILPSSKKPYKVKEHRDAHKRTIDPQSTSFYVPRTEANPTSNDRRCLTNKMIYVPATDALPHESVCAVRIGSRDNLSGDIRDIEAPDVRLFTDMVANNLLCYTALKAPENR